jgi:capsular polysaccharide biosynthesis protein
VARIDHWTAEAFSAEEFEDLALDPGPPVSIRSLKSAVKRRKRLWIATALVGLILGASLHVLLPSKITAVTRLYLVEPATGGDSTMAISNDISLLGTRKVAEAAMAILHLRPTQPTIAYKGTAEGTALMAITATGSTAAEAKARTNAVAQAFLQVRAQLQKQSTDDQVASQQAELKSLEAEIQSLGPDGVAGIERGSDISQKTALTVQIAQEQSSQASASRQSVVLDTAYLVPVSAKKTAVKDGLAGLIAGLVLGMMIVIIGELLSDRVRARSDVASALGAPVELSVGSLK